MSQDQHGHLDALMRGMLVLMNLMSGKSYLGVYLGSGSCVEAMRTLIDEGWYDAFENFFTRHLVEKMSGTDPKEKLERAWRIFSMEKLKEQGLEGMWKRAYLELDEFHLFVGSYGVFHFGARFPLFFGDDALRDVPLDWFSLRLHLYSGDDWVPAKDSNMCAAGHRHPVQAETIALEDPIPLMGGSREWKPAFHPRWEGMKALNQFRPKFE